MADMSCPNGAAVAELADAHDSKSCGVTHESSILSRGTICTERDGLKIHCPQGHVASILSRGIAVAFSLLFGYACRGLDL